MTHVDRNPQGLLLVDPATGFLGLRALATDRFELWASTYDADDRGSRGQITGQALAEFANELQQFPGTPGNEPRAPELAGGAVRIAVSGRGNVALSVHRPEGAEPSFVISLVQRQVDDIVAQLATL